MNKYDRFFEFRIAGESDINGIMSFIRKYWDESHILGNDIDFFRYHYCEEDGSVNVYLMIDKQGEISGMLGFVQYSSTPQGRYFSGSIAKVKRDLPLPMCGVELMNRFYEYIAPYVEFACGTNPKTILPLFKNIFKYQTGKMEQFFFLNEYLNEYRIISIPDSIKIKIAETGNSYADQYCLHKKEKIDDIDFDFNKKYEHLPIKSKEFIDKRYFHHPVFAYDVYGIENGEECKGILFTREIVYNSSSLILIVDFLGDIQCCGHIQNALKNILYEKKAECFSLLVANFPSEILKSSGFYKLESEDVIIPTYFEPFVKQNVSNYFESSEQGMIIFKATGDQDNPRYARKRKVDIEE